LNIGKNEFDYQLWMSLVSKPLHASKVQANNGWDLGGCSE
jgi:hypothetical protein